MLLLQMQAQELLEVVLVLLVHALQILLLLLQNPANPSRREVKKEKLRRINFKFQQTRPPTNLELLSLRAVELDRLLQRLDNFCLGREQKPESQQRAKKVLIFCLQQKCRES